MHFAKKNISEKLIFTAATTTILPFSYGVALLLVQALDLDYIQKTYQVSLGVFFSMCFFILFLAAAVSNFVLYSFPRGQVATFAFCVPFSAFYISLKTYYLTDKTAIFFCDAVIALLISTIFFAFLVTVSSVYSRPLETRVALSIASICFALGFGFFNVKEHQLCILLSRVFIGFAAGCIGKYLPCYLSLISPIEKRGIFSSLFSLGLIGGLLVFNAFLPFFKSYATRESWITPIFFLLYPTLMIFCIPLSIKDSHDNTLYSLLIHKKSFKSLFFVSAFNIATNLCGINQLALSPQSIYGKEYAFHSAANLFIGLLASFVCGHLFEKFGRKKIAMASCTVIICCCIAFYFKFYVIITAYLFSLGFNLGMGSLPHVVLSEIFPEEYISPGAFFGTQCNWIGSAISTIIPQGDVSTPYNPAFIVYFVSTLSFVICITAFFKETKGITPRFQ